jgi:DNA segregation ATPase FtsK/SpoIIIE-like protein
MRTGQRIKVRVAQIAGLRRDLALALFQNACASRLPVLGVHMLGIEVPNTTSMVRLRSILETDTFYKVGSHWQSHWGAMSQDCQSWQI